MLKVCVVVIRILFVWCGIGYVDGMCKQDYELSKPLKNGLFYGELYFTLLYFTLFFMYMNLQNISSSKKSCRR